MGGKKKRKEARKEEREGGRKEGRKEPLFPVCMIIKGNLKKTLTTRTIKQI